MTWPSMVWLSSGMWWYILHLHLVQCRQAGIVAVYLCSRCYTTVGGGVANAAVAAAVVVAACFMLYAPDVHAV